MCSVTVNDLKFIWPSVSICDFAYRLIPRPVAVSMNIDTSAVRNRSGIQVCLLPKPSACLRLSYFKNCWHAGILVKLISSCWDNVIGHIVLSTTNSDIAESAALNLRPNFLTSS